MFCHLGKMSFIWTYYFGKYIKFFGQFKLNFIESAALFDVFKKIVAKKYLCLKKTNSLVGLTKYLSDWWYLDADDFNNEL